MKHVASKNSLGEGGEVMNTSSGSSTGRRQLDASRSDAVTNELWQRLGDFEFGDESAEFNFAARLARDNGWPAELAQEAIDEYRCFLFLGRVAGHPVTPSDEVDQVWHLHLTYTRSYWDDLCGEVLGAPFHHEPTTGGAAEATKFTDWYTETLKSYAAWFGTAPPARWWPPADHRFADASAYVRINVKDKWLLDKPRISRRGQIKIALLWLFWLLSAALVVRDAESVGAAIVLLGGVVLWSLRVALADPFRWNQTDKSRRGGGSGGGLGFFGDGSDSSDGSGCGGGGGGCGGGGGGGGGCGGGGGS